MPKLVPDLLKALTLLAAAILCAGLANGLAGPERKLGWGAWSPAPMAAAPVAVPAEAPAAGPAPAAPPEWPAAPVRPLAKQPSKPAIKPPTPAAPPASPAPLDAAARFPPAPASVIRELDSDSAWTAFQLKVPFLDARRSADFEEGHVAGAWSLPVWEAGLEARLIGFEAKANPQPKAPLVVYCSGGDCEDSHLLARKLVELGYRNLLIYRDGFPDWSAKGRPVARGARP